MLETHGAGGDALSPSGMGAVGRGSHDGSPAAPRPSTERPGWDRFRRNRSALVGAALVAWVVAAAVAAPLLAPHDPLEIFDHGLTEIGAPLPPGKAFWLGSDRLGRDLLSRLLYGARISLLVGVLANFVALGIGLFIGLWAGYFGGRTDTVLMRFANLMLAFPYLLLVIAIVSLLDRRGLGILFVVLGLVGWTTMARVIRSKVLALRELDFVQAARALGVGHAQIIVRHILPNVVGPLVVLATMGIAVMILFESALSYLGLGVPAPVPTWGSMIAEGQPYFRTAPWLVIAPGAAILVTVLGFNLLGEGLRDALDPKDER